MASDRDEVEPHGLDGGDVGGNVAAPAVGAHGVDEEEEEDFTYFWLSFLLQTLLLGLWPRSCMPRLTEQGQNECLS